MVCEMVVKKCVICEDNFETKTNTKMCDNCKRNGYDKIRKREQNKKAVKRYEKRTGRRVKRYYENRVQEEIRGCIKRGLPVPEFYLNSREHPGMHAHHFLPRTIIYMPGDIHFSKHHSLKTKKNMIEMNELAISYLLNGV